MVSACLRSSNSFICETSWKENMGIKWNGNGWRENKARISADTCHTE